MTVEVLVEFTPALPQPVALRANCGSAGDLALSFLMLHHVGTWEAALQELVRVVRPGGRVIGCDMVHSRFLDWSERTFGSGEERLITLEAFDQEVPQLKLRDWHTQRGPLHVFRFALAV